MAFMTLMTPFIYVTCVTFRKWHMSYVTKIIVHLAIVISGIQRMPLTIIALNYFKLVRTVSSHYFCHFINLCLQSTSAVLCYFTFEV